LENFQKTLICPLNWGLGHATRCVPIIRGLVAEGNEVVIAADGYPLQFLHQEFPELRIIELPSYPIRYSKGKSQVFVMLRFLPKLYKGIKREHEWLDHLLQSEHFDTIISDNRFGLWNKSLHTIYMTHQLMIKMPKGLRWLEPVAYRFHRHFITKYDECWIPDFAEDGGLSGDLSHKYPLTVNAKFIGILSRFSGYENVEPDNTYKTVIILSGVEPQRSIFEQEMLNKYRDVNEKTLVILGKPTENSDIKIEKAVSIVTHLDTKKMASVLLGCSTIISRSGYTTIMDLQTLNVLHKAILYPTPGQTEQEYLADYIHSKGLV